MGLLANGGAGAWVVALLVWPLASMLPGYLVVSVLDPGRATLDRWAVAPLVSVAIAFLAAVWIDWLRPGSGLGAALAALTASSLVAIVVMRHRGQRVLLLPRRWSRSLTALASLMGASLVVGASVVLRSAGGLASVVPNDDGNGHGSFVAQILLTGSVDPVIVTSVDLGGGTAPGAFYPLGMHLLAAMVASLSSVPAALVVLGLIVGAVWAPLAAYVLARRFADATVAAVAAGALAVATPWFPYAQMAWGGWPLIIAVSLVPAAVLLMLDLRSPGGLPVASLALAGLLALHITELVVVGIVAGLTVALDGTALRARLRRAVLMLAAATASLLVLLPFTRELGRTQGIGLVDATHMGVVEALREVVQKPYFGFEAPGALFGWVLTAWSVVSLMLLVVGTRVLWRSVVARGVLVAGWLFLALAFAAYVGALGTLTSPWYGSGNRLLAQASALAVFPLSAATMWLLRGARRRRPHRVVAVSLGTVGVLVCGMLVVRTVQTGDASFARAMVTSDHVAAFRWLSAASDPGDQVLNDPRAGSVWLFEDSGGDVVPVFGPKHDWSADPAWAGRVYLRDHVADAATDARVRTEAATWHVRYVLLGPAVVPGGTPTLDAAAISSSPGLREVFRSGDVRVYELPRT